jgi:hypothetical protein
MISMRKPNGSERVEIQSHGDNRANAWILAKRAARTTGLLMVLAILVGCSRDPLAEARAQTASPDHWAVGEITLKDQTKRVNFVTKSQNKIDTPRGPVTAEMSIGCAADRPHALVVYGISEIANDDVAISFDGSAPDRQKWEWPDPGMQIYLEVPKSRQNDFVFKLAKARSFAIEMTPQGGTPQLAKFKLRNIKELMSLVKECKPWLAAAHVDPS